MFIDIDDIKTIVCSECRNDKFNITESLLGGFGLVCANCGFGHLFGPTSILKGEDKEIDI